MTQNKQPMKIYREEVKDRQTSHWDWDYLPRDQIDDAVGRGDWESSKKAPKRRGGSSGGRLLALIRRFFYRQR